MGSGYRTFTAGEVLTASNVQDYLMDQSVMSFADSTARATGIGTANFEEGMLSYLANTNQLEVYDGAAWSQIGQTPGLVKINTTSFSAVSSQSVNDVFSTTYTNYRIVIASTNASNGTWNFRLRVGGADASGSNYFYATSLIVSGAGTQAALQAESQTSIDIYENGSAGASLEMDIHNVFNAQSTMFSYMITDSRGSGSGAFRSVFGGAQHTLSTSYTGFTFYSSHNMTGSVSVYGYNK